MSGELTLERVEALARDERCINLVAACLVKEAKADLIREKVDEYLKPVFESFDFRVTITEKISKRRLGEYEHGDKITNSDHIYLDVDDEKSKRYFAACHAAHLANDFADMIDGKEPGFCPALIARSEFSNAKRDLALYAAEYLGMPEGAANYPHSDKLVDLITGAVLSGPAGESLQSSVTVGV